MPSNKTASTNTKTVLITGATRGIGNKLAETYAKLGWNVIGGARDPTKADLVRTTRRTLAYCCLLLLPAYTHIIVSGLCLFIYRRHPTRIPY